MTQEPGKSRSKVPKPGRTATHLPPVRELQIDPYRHIAFPNRIREYRKNCGHRKLVSLKSLLPEIPYIRLSKIERGEVVAKAQELRQIAAILGVAPQDFIIDIDAPHFDMQQWALENNNSSANPAELALALKVGSALRRLRTGRPDLTINVLSRDYHIPPVLLSRLEHGLRPIDSWNDATKQALYTLFEVKNLNELKRVVLAAYDRGELDLFLEEIANPHIREQNTRNRTRKLLAELSAPPTNETTHPAHAQPVVPAPSAPQAVTPAALPPPRAVEIFGTPLADGLIARTLTRGRIEVPSHAGPRAFGLRVLRPTLGHGLPGSAIVIVDPDQFPSVGSLAVLDEGTGLRLIAVMVDRDGTMMGYSENPHLEIPLNTVDPANLAAVTGAVFA